MAESKLIITTNAKQVAEELKQVSDGLKDVTKSQQELTNSAKQSTAGYEKTAGAIKDTQKASESLRMSVEEQREWDKKALQNQMDMYVKVQTVRKKQTEEEIKNLKEVGKETDAISEKVGNFAKKWGVVAVALAVTTKVFKDVLKVLADTNIGMKVLTATGEFWSQLTYNIATGNFNMAESFRVAAKAAQLINEHREKELKDIVEISKKRKDYNQLYFEASDLTATDTERYIALNKAMLAHDVLIEKEIERAKEELQITRIRLASRQNSYKLRKRESEQIAAIIDLEGRAFSETKRLERQLTGLLKGFFDDVHSATEVLMKLLTNGIRIGPMKG